MVKGCRREDRASKKKFLIERRVRRKVGSETPEEKKGQ